MTVSKLSLKIIWKRLEKNLRGSAKFVLTRTTNFINKNKLAFDKQDLLIKIRKIEDIYIDFDRAIADLQSNSSEMKGFSEKAL